MASEFPEKYNDPVYASLDAKTEAKLGLPSGLLSSIRTNGERTDHGRVSSAGAETPYQFIPATQAAIKKKYGIDVKLSPENASEGAGLLLQESLKRNNNDPAAAIGEYVAGIDRGNWGKVTNAYINRVMVGQKKATATIEPQSTFDRVKSEIEVPPDSAITNIYNAYKGGQMNPEQKAAFEADVNGGKLMLPKGASLQTAAPPAPSGGVENILAAYTAGRMNDEQRQAFERDVNSGALTLPNGQTLPKIETPGVMAQAADMVTGNLRKTAETDALPDWAGMPEMNQMSLAGAKAGIGTLMSSPEETAKIIQANFPGVQARQDEKGNYLLRSSQDGKEYAIKPGFQPSDIPRALGIGAAFTPAGAARSIGGMALASGATQGVIEASQAATGGSFDPKEVGIAAVAGGAVPLLARAGGAAINAGKSGLSKLRGVPEPIPAPAAAAREAAAVAPSVPEPTTIPPVASTAAKPLAADELAQTARKAAEGGLGSGRAAKILAGETAPDAATVNAAKRLGIEEHLQPDHVTTNQAYRELAQAVKSIPGSETRAAEMQGLEKIGARAEKLIDDIGGTSDLSMVSATVKKEMQTTQKALEDKADELYTRIRQEIPQNAPAPAENVLSFISKRADDLGGKENLSPMEKKLLARLSPKLSTKLEQAVADPEQAGLLLGARARPVQQKIEVVKQPTYTLLDDARKDVGAAARMSGPFKDADTGLAKKLYELITEDQSRVVGSHGATELFNTARAAVATRKALEDDLVSLFGKALDGSIVGDLSGAVRSVSQGDTARLVRLLKAVPDNQRQMVMASGLSSAFRSAGTKGPISFTQYAKWYEGLLRNKQAYTAVMSNLPGPARKQLSDLYRVSQGISAASRERITTGRIQAFTEQFKGADNLVDRIYAVARKSAVGATAGTAAGAVFGPGVGAAVASALTGGAKTQAIKAADALLASPEFAQMVKAGGKETVKAKRLANSAPFKRFAAAVGKDSDLSNRERWILQVIQGQNNTQD
ncbi:MAG: hypothetical protein EOP14_00235 [Pseudomonas sp.]|nr:MAG: hypothetical protein EOP14_00235 [Pseudomonas sp.]